VTPPAVERYFAAVNDEDWATIRDVFAPDAELRSVGAPTRHDTAAVGRMVRGRA
jgi:ketosteroid isomerase-like protein